MADNYHQPEPPSKSQRKREAQQLFKLGTELAALDDSSLASIPIPGDLFDAVQKVRAMTAHVARKRQLQYIAKLLRNMDSEPIRHALAELRQDARHHTARYHRIEAWRDVLIEAGDVALSSLIRQQSLEDPQRIRQLVRKARHEQARRRPPAARRALFRLLRELDQKQPLPPPDKD